MLGRCVQALLTIGGPHQAIRISFCAPASTPLTSGPVTLAASASSALAVSYASNSTAVCTVSGSTVTLLTAG